MWKKDRGIRSEGMKGAKIMDEKKSEIWTDIVAVLQAILIFLKLLGLIEWSWWVVFAPILIMIGILLLMIIAAIIINYISG